jgi:hypothetical protein
VKKVLSTLAVSLVLTLITLSPVAAQLDIGVVDQSNSNFTPPLFQNVRMFSPFGQEFTPSIAGLDVVELWFEDFGSPGSNPPPPPYPIQLRVNIRKANISGAIVGTSGTAELPQRFDGPVAFTFSSLVKLHPGDLYVIEVVLATGPDAGGGSSGGPDSTYLDGNQILLGVQQSNNDLWFKEGLANTTPLNKDYCKSDLWQYLKRSNGSVFKNQGDCIQFVNTGN